MSEKRILGLSFEQFRSLFESCERLDATEKKLNAWTMMIAAQASGKSMEKWATRWDAILEGRHDDAAKLIQRFGSGI